MDYLSLLYKYYPEDDDLRRLLLKHSRQVADRCLLIADRHPELSLDRQFLEEAAMLHDIGVRWCHAPSIFCTGEEHYIRHGLIGGQLLRQEGLERHARVCERHTGTGITREQIQRQSLPLPLADYVPETLEEQLVCYADKFYSKSRPDCLMSVEQVAQSLAKFGQEGVEKFLQWAALFEPAEERQQVVSTELFRTSQSWDGVQLPDYFQGRPELVAVKYVFPAGQRLATHHHPVINFGLLAQGELTIISQDGLEKTVHEGETLVEMVNTIHYGENRGTKPAILYMFYLSQEGLPLSVKQPESPTN